VFCKEQSHQIVLFIMKSKFYPYKLKRKLLYMYIEACA